MSMYGQKDGLFWPSLFSFDEEKEKKQLLKEIKQHTHTFNHQHLYSLMLPHSSTTGNLTDHTLLQSVCERVALKFILEDTDLSEDLLSQDEFEKAKEVYTRKQYNSKILQNLLDDFSYLLVRTRDRENFSNLSNYFIISIRKEYLKAQEEAINLSFGSLKKVVDRVSAGVKAVCYLETTQTLRVHGVLHEKLLPELNKFLAEKYHYDWNAVISSQIYGKDTSTLLSSTREDETLRLLQQSLLDDLQFWTSHPHFNPITFVNVVAKQNSISHARKILSHLMDNLSRLPHMDMVISHGFPIYVSLYTSLCEDLENQAHRFSFNCLRPYVGDVSVLKHINLCYPMNQADAACIQKGKTVWENFICVYNYPQQGKQVSQYLQQEVHQFVMGDTRQDDDIAVILDGNFFRFGSCDNQDRQIFTAYHPDCFSEESIWTRVYLTAYAVTQLSNDETQQFAFLQRIFIFLIRELEKRQGFRTTHQMDMSTRIKQYEKLKALLHTQGIGISDDKQSNYVIALLDRDTATREETECFPMLEQLGDAVYGLAVAELLFYRPDILEMGQLYEQYTNATTQVAITKKHKYHQLYLHMGLPAKYVDDDLDFNIETIHEVTLQAKTENKYLADMLEMLIGAICLDLGIGKALAFTKQLLQNTFPKQFSEEIHPIPQYYHDSSIDRDYWTRIRPGLCSTMEIQHHILWKALSKALLTSILGTNTSAERQYITRNVYGNAAYGEEDSYGISKVFYDYFNCGLAYTIATYSNIICDIYAKHSQK